MIYILNILLFMFLHFVCLHLIFDFCCYDVFIHLGPLLQLPTFTALWLTLLDFMEKYMKAEHNDLLAEAIPEMMKNLLLVMETAGVFGTTDSEETQLWNMTWDRIDVFLPGLRQEVSRSKTPVARIQPEVVTELPLELPSESVPVPDVVTQCDDQVPSEALESNSNPIVLLPNCADKNAETELVTSDPSSVTPDASTERPSSADNPLTLCNTNDIPSLPIPLPVSKQELCQSALWTEELPIGLPIFTPAPVEEIETLPTSENGTDGMKLPLPVSTNSNDQSIPTLH